MKYQSRNLHLQRWFEGFCLFTINQILGSLPLKRLWPWGKQHRRIHQGHFPTNPWRRLPTPSIDTATLPWKLDLHLTPRTAHSCGAATSPADTYTPQSRRGSLQLSNSCSLRLWPAASFLWSLSTPAYWLVQSILVPGRPYGLTRRIQGRQLRLRRTSLWPRKHPGRRRFCGGRLDPRLPTHRRIPGRLGKSRGCRRMMPRRCQVWSPSSTRQWLSTRSQLWGFPPPGQSSTTVSKDLIGCLDC